MKTFFFGLGAGLGLGVLLAPRRGSETREQLRRAGEKLVDAARRQADNLGNVARNLPEQIQKAGQQAAEFTRNAVSQVRDAAGQLGGGILGLLNAGSREELMNVRGIGPVLADRIIASRPFTSPRQLVDRGILSENTLEELTREAKSA